MTDQELQLALAKMLPGKIKLAAEFCKEGGEVISRCFQWQYPAVADVETIGQSVTSREWLHVCWLVEHELTMNDWTPYLDELDKITTSVHICPTTHALSNYCASWQQRAEALSKVKGTEV